MKKQIMRICAAVFAAVIFASAFSVFGAYEELDRATFSGRGEVLAPADRATVNFCIEASAKKEAVAKKGKRRNPLRSEGTLGIYFRRIILFRE